MSLPTLTQRVESLPYSGGSSGSSSGSSGDPPLTDTGYLRCQTGRKAIDKLGIDYSNPFYSNKSVIHAYPTWTARYVYVSDEHTSSELHNCIPLSYPGGFLLRYNSWQGLVDQFDCHDFAPLSIGTGPTWDLEGSRGAEGNILTWIRSGSNW